MSGFSKISSTIVIVFVMSFLGFTFLTFFQIRDNIAEETEAALAQATEMLRLNMTAGELEQVLAQSPHLSVQRIQGRLSYQQTQDHPYEQGWAQLSLSQLKPLVVPISENQYLVITPHEQAELVQNLNFFWLVAGLFLTTLALLLFTIRAAIRHRLKPLKNLAIALKSLAEGRHHDNLVAGDIDEVKQVIGRFLHLQHSLEQKNHQLLKIDKKLAMLQEQERMYLAQELHDNVGQLLTTIKAHAYILTHANDRGVIETSAEKVQSFSQRISDAIRQLTHHLHPLTLDKVSLQESLQRLVYEQEQVSNATQWRVSINLAKYPSEKERDIHIYRFIQEAINNVVKHAYASHVVVDVFGDEHGVNVTIRDNGVGFDCNVSESIGMSSMRSRARCIGAEYSISAEPKKGVTVAMQLALDEHLTELSTVAA